MKKILSTILFLSITILVAPSYASKLSTIQTFNSSDYKSIIKNQHNKPFIMLFWSIDCSPCLKEMSEISKLSKDKRDKFIFISTDGHEMKQEISNLLFSRDLEKENNWVFNSDETERIISIIDKHWYGETPRSYYFDKNKKRSLLKNN